MSLPLVIDTDPALGVVYDGRPHDVDDAFAIAEALLAPDVQVAGITVVHGNSRLADGLAVAREVTALAGVEAPVHPGAAEALTAHESPPETDAVAFLHDRLGEGRLRIAAIGPLTNLGALLQRHPEDAAAIEEVVIVAGRTAGRAFHLGERGPVADFNFESDPLAARVLLESGVPVTMTGFELSSRVSVTPEALERIRRVDTPLTRRLAAGSEAWMDFWRREFPSDAGFHPWDSAAIAWIRDRSLFVDEPRGWRIRDVSRGNGGVVPWLETQPELPGPRVTFVGDFAPGGAARFLERLSTGLGAAALSCP